MAQRFGFSRIVGWLKILTKVFFSFSRPGVARLVLLQVGVSGRQRRRLHGQGDGSPEAAQDGVGQPATDQEGSLVQRPPDGGIV